MDSIRVLMGSVWNPIDSMRILIIPFQDPYGFHKGPYGFDIDPDGFYEDAYGFLSGSLWNR